MELLKNINIVSQINPLATATSDSTSATVVDMAGYEGVVFFSIVGQSTAGSTGGQYQLKVKYADSTSSTAFSNFTDALAGKASGVTTGYIGDVVAVDVYKPVNRYLKATLDRGTKSVASGGVFAVQYGPRVASVTQSTTYVMDSGSFISPST